MEEELQKLFNAFERDGDLRACVEIVSRNFPAFAENEIIYTFPDEVLVDILCSDKLQFPEPEKTVEFFSKLFDRSADSVGIYFPLIPIDDLTKDQCKKLAEKLESMKCIVEARQMRRVVNLYQMIDDAYSNLRSNGESTATISDKLAHSTELLNRMTVLLQQTSKSLDETTKELQKKTEEVTQKEEEITRLKFRLRSKR